MHDPVPDRISCKKRQESFSMLNYLWAGMILIGIVYASFTGRIPDITNAAIDSSKEAVSLCITMMGVLSMWMGLMKIAEKGGIITQASLKLKPLIRFLFPNLPSGHSSEEYIVTNFIANFLGLGWAATTRCCAPTRRCGCS